MKKLIELDAAIKATWKDTGYTDPLNVMTAIRDRIEALPTVDAVSVVHGRWTDIGGIIRWGCPFCHHAFEVRSNYCPNCGASLDIKGGNGNG